MVVETAKCELMNIVMVTQWYGAVRAVQNNTKASLTSLMSGARSFRRRAGACNRGLTRLAGPARVHTAQRRVAWCGAGRVRLRQQ